MRALLLFVLLPLVVSPIQNSSPSAQDGPVAVVSFKWAKTKLTLDQVNSSNPPPAAAMIPANKNFERNRRANMPPGDRDPNQDSVDGRSAALEKTIQESRAPKPVAGFVYRAKLKNTSPKVIEVLFWEYQSHDVASPTTLSRRQFLCGVSISPEKAKEFEGFSLSGPSDVVTVESLAKNSSNALQEKIVINRVEYNDGSIWQRPDWNFGEIKLTYQRALRTPWIPDMCKGL